MHEGSVTFLPSLAPPNSYLHSPQHPLLLAHLFITSAPILYKRNKKSHLLILLSQSSCHAPSDSLGLGPLLGLSILYLVSIILPGLERIRPRIWETCSKRSEISNLGFMGLSILYLVSISMFSILTRERVYVKYLYILREINLLLLHYIIYFACYRTLL